MRGFKATAVIAFLLIWAFTGCALLTSKEEVLSVGKVDGRSYGNEFFGITIEYPESWTIATDEEMDDMRSAAMETLEENGTSQETLDLSDQKSVYLSMGTKYPRDYIDGFNPNIICIAENLGLVGSAVVKDAGDYMEYARQSLLDAGMGYEAGDTAAYEIDGREFSCFEANTDFPGILVYQKLFAFVHKGYALVLTISYTSEDEKEELMEIVDGIRFD